MAEHLQALIEQIQDQPNPAARALLEDCLQSLLAFYGEGLSRVLHHVQASDSQVLERLLKDPAVSGLLLIHGLHPVSLERRLGAALDKVRPYMASHGGNVELVSLENEIARLRLHGTCQGCPSSAVTIELALRKAIEEECPDLAGLEVEGGLPAHGPPP